MVTFIESTKIEFSVNGEEYDVGILLTSFNVSHLVGCGLYSKSVSINV